ncbi:alkaline phosphatase [Alcanivorax nanhaiticus]|uniref:Alkaline phosphatase n=1 Tax=Alcanivorax nanhaiticus TaxID=1177154 RepID=A0A095UP29_9GAMM|nr:alkaline phosphatase [Alcanivorax nanhaiticus]KGD64275.1 alkaline phosphatase [Alcanivorax nanhaiticus]
MSQRVFKLALTGLAAGVMVSANADGVALPAYQSSSDWFTAGSEKVVEKADLSRETQRAKNVILFVGDGMGISTLTAARILQGQLAGGDGEENLLSFEAFPYSALVKTYNTNQQTPDSAGTMTAMMSGVKNKAGMINISSEGLRADCASSKGNELNTFLDLMEITGRSTGVVSTARITHATPAATYSRVPERNWESDDGLTEEAKSGGCKDIADQLVSYSYGDGVDVILGGGRRHFLPSEEGGKRQDGRDLTTEWLQRYEDSGEQAVYLQSGTELDGQDLSSTDKLMGLFTSSHMSYDADRAASGSDEPTIAEMTESAIQVLEKNDKGFFLMVESGRIDHAHHAGNAYNALHDAVAFSDAVQAAVDAVDLDETLILVTADHSHVFTIAGYPTKGNPILGKVVTNDGSGAPEEAAAQAGDGMPYTTLGYTNGLGYADLGDETDADARYASAADAGRKDLSAVDVEAPGYHQETLVPMGSETHAGEDISLHAVGAGSWLVQGNIEQNTLFHIMTRAAVVSSGK